MEGLARLHRLVGVATVITFLATGAYLNRYLPPPELSTHLKGVLFRSAHIYLVLSGLINISIGTYLSPAGSRGGRMFQTAGSLLLLLAPVVILIAFLQEPPRASLDRPITLLAMIAILSGTLLHLLVGRRRMEKTYLELKNAVD